MVRHQQAAEAAGPAERVALEPIDTKTGGGGDQLATPTDSNPERCVTSMDRTSVLLLSPASNHTSPAAEATFLSAAAAATDRFAVSDPALHGRARQGSHIGPDGMQPLSQSNPEIPQTGTGEATPRAPLQALASPPLTASAPQSAASSVQSPQLGSAAGALKPLPTTAGEEERQSIDERPMSTLLLVAATDEDVGPRETNWFRRQSKSSSETADTGITLGSYEAQMLRAQAQRNAALADVGKLEEQVAAEQRDNARLRKEAAQMARKLRTEYELRTAAEAKCSAMECELAELSSNIQFEAQNLVARERREHRAEIDRLHRSRNECSQLLEMETAQVAALKQSLEEATESLDRERAESARLRAHVSAFERQFSPLVTPQHKSSSSSSAVVSRSTSPAPRASAGSPLPAMAVSGGAAHITGQMLFSCDAARPDARLAEFVAFINSQSEKDAQAGAFMQRSMREDVGPTLTPGGVSLSGWTRHRRLLHSVQDTTLILESFAPRVSLGRVVSPACCLCSGSVARRGPSASRAMHRMRLSDDDMDSKPLCAPCHARMVSVCCFFSYLKIVRRGLIKRPLADVWLEVNRARLQMWLARSGADPDSQLSIAGAAPGSAA
ncbi:RAB3A interacting protein [Coemansia sp. RSA 552]|nr:RAB3A interacting protein [Coemansia sp. RSA 552]